MTGRAAAPSRPDWAEPTVEEAQDPGQPIVDAHHHLYVRPGIRYLADEYLADIRSSGHDVRASVFVQARSMYRPDGPEALRPVGETAFAARVNAGSALAPTPVALCEAIVAYADLTRGKAVGPVLDAHGVAAGGRLRGVRHVLCWDPDPALLNPAYPTTEAMMESDAFRAGYAELGRRGLSFDAWLFHPQIPRLAALVDSQPDVPVVLDHCGGILGTGPYRGRRDASFAAWAEAIRAIARRPNVFVKLGGLGMGLSGFGYEAGPDGPSSASLAEAWRPWMETCIEAFGPARCMFESNYPADAGGHGFGQGWNAMKRIASGASAGDRADLFWRTASRFYRLEAGIDARSLP